jgi:DNA-binding NtrC family response regulator
VARVLVVDDDNAVRSSLTSSLEEAGHEIEAVATAQAALKAVGASPRDSFDIVLLDLGLPDRHGLEVLAELKKRSSETPVVVISGETDMSSTVRAMRDGAFDFLAKPFKPEELEQRVGRALRVAAGRPTPPPSRRKSDEPEHDLVGTSSAIREVYKLLGLLSACHTTVLIRGESGTGKELAARILHAFGSTASEPFIAINCAALPGPLVEAEIFGYARGAFTGASQDRPGKLEAAGEGTVFLDEIGEVPLETQVKLLRVLQERKFERLGETESRPLRARIVAATHRHLESLVKEGRFRDDLYYRLNVATVTLPPLRERWEDVPVLAQRLLAQISLDLGRPIAGLSAGAQSLLLTHDWPGNVRELRNALTRAAVRCRGTVIQTEDLELTLKRQADTASALPAAMLEKTDSPAAFPTLDEVEKELVRRALVCTRGHRGRACALLGISRPTLLRKIRIYGLETPER